ncbi:BQ2448_1591 [Microbotryum intermedium]|uniref:BQ2448_1591 protein n=1 Tax=Microbotryum intermedium TaxID=269621 RepID=A0A238FAJ8_9BASI|nr:BQ2448_1591 [Microbotryum intermedium]
MLGPGPVLALLELLVAIEVAQVNAAYTLYKNYSGSTFFDEWTFFGNYDNLTNGDTIWVNKSASSQLAYVNSAGRAIIKVDNASVVPYSYKRDSVRISTNTLFGIGSLWIYDAYHVPYGCSVWPAMWSVCANWPLNGEIDTFEGEEPTRCTCVSQIHTETGCIATGTSSTMTGNLTYSNCSTSANYNSGCTIKDPRETSYGADFATNGGGVWATEFASTGIKIWFFPRALVPSDLLATNTSAQPNPSGWGLPVANYPSQPSCDISTYFGPQKLTIDITMCGDWAGTASVYNQTCTLRQSCYLDNVLNASNYDTAYFELGSVRVYNDGSASATSTVVKTSSIHSATATGANTVASTTSSSASRASMVFGSQGVVASALVVVMMAFGAGLLW